MTRLARLAAVASVLFGTICLVPAAARADHCEPIDNPDPIPGQNREWCHTQEPSDTPEPTDPPSTPAPTRATAAPPPAATRRPTAPTTRTTPAPTVIDNVEVPTTDPLGTPEIIVEGPIADDQPLDVAEPSASASSWIFGFIVGLLIGGFAGRASWGLRRRRRQQIFG
jgi:hypothetical protein